MFLVYYDLQVYSTNGTVSSDLMLAFLDDFAKQIKQKTVVVLDNAPIHHSEEFQEQIAIWEEQDLFIFFLPSVGRQHTALILILLNDYG